MKKKVRKALEGSIRKWKRIVKGKARDKGYTNCPLCQLFDFQHKVEGACIKCPVGQKVNNTSCMSTPFADWDAYRIPKKGKGYDFTEFPEALKQAKRELKFLKSLRP